jgi:Mannosyl-glycoprotein endo-beta-N-acetylglucosaminidase
MTTVPLLAAPRAGVDAFERHLLSRKHGAYSDEDVRSILRRYVATATAAGLDPLLVVSQLVLETRNLDSFWAQRPRRNPAGIGVTGEPGIGISFPSWDKAVHAHVGRLLAYALHDDAANATQRALIDEALDVRPLPSDRRGCAPTVQGLAGTWAADRAYADKIIRLANQIRSGQ